MVSALRQTPDLQDPPAWAIRLVLQFIFDNMHTDGDLRGGWGKSYAERYLRETYPHGIPRAVDLEDHGRAEASSARDHQRRVYATRRCGPVAPDRAPPPPFAALPHRRAPLPRRHPS